MKHIALFIACFMAGCSDDEPLPPLDSDQYQVCTRHFFYNGQPLTEGGNFCSDITRNLTINLDNTSKNTNLSALSSITSIGGDLIIEGNSSLKALDGLDNLRVVGGDLTISQNPGLQSLEALRNLGSIGGDFIVRSNSSLPNLSGTTELTSVGGNLTISLNNNLTTIEGLEVLEKVGGTFSITDNPSLCDRPSVDRLKASFPDLLAYGLRSNCTQNQMN